MSSHSVRIAPLMELTDDVGPAARSAPAGRTAATATSILFIGTPIEQFIDKIRDGVMTTL
jgi:hypothetical protein